jgi:hypothetical protein
MTPGEIRQYEDKFRENIYHILRENVRFGDFAEWGIDPSTDYEDSFLSFDMVYHGKVMVSVRIRKNQYLRYKDFTIRSRSKNGMTCEIDKLRSGLGKIYFYGWMTEDEQGLASWAVVDIDKMRPYLDHGRERTNPDGTKFMAYNFEGIKKVGALVAFA